MFYKYSAFASDNQIVLSKALLFCSDGRKSNKTDYILDNDYIEELGDDYLSSYEKIFVEHPENNIDKLIESFTKTDEFWIKEYVSICGEAVTHIFIQKNNDFNKVDKEIKEEYKKQDAKIIKGDMQKVKTCNVFRFLQGDKLIIPLVEGEVYLYIRPYEKTYYFSQLFMNKISCVTETSFRPKQINKSFKEYLDKKFGKVKEIYHYKEDASYNSYCKSPHLYPKCYCDDRYNRKIISSESIDNYPVFELLFLPQFDDKITYCEEWKRVLESKETLYLKVYSVSCGESTENITITKLNYFKNLDDNFEKEVNAFGGEIYTGNKPLKIQTNKIYKLYKNCVDSDFIVYCLVKEQVYLLVKSYIEEQTRKYVFNQLFFNQLACTSETSYYPDHINLSFKKHLDSFCWYENK